MRQLTQILSALTMIGLSALTTSATPVTAPMLDVYGDTLTHYLANPTQIQMLQPRYDQRGVDIDGTLKFPSPLGWAIAADPLGGGVTAGRMLGDVNLCNGSYNPLDVDLALPTLGLPVVIGRTYNQVSLSSGSRVDFLGATGWNWAAMMQPEIVLAPGATNDLDVLYLVYGADRYIEFKRIALNATEFKAKNGAAGVVTYQGAGMSTAEVYTYYDQRGNQLAFFGFDGNAGFAKGQLWSMTNPEGTVAYAGSLTLSGAPAAGYTATTGTGVVNGGRSKLWYDGSGRKYDFTYVTVGSTSDLLQTVVVSKPNGGGGWIQVAQVDYDYYNYTSTTISGQPNILGLEGDLKKATITLKGVTGGDYIRTKYYRYYVQGYSNSAGLRGEPHWLKMVVGFDGVRQKGAGYDSNTTADSTLLPFAESYLEYGSAITGRLSTALFNGNCGCSGGTSGTYSFAYDVTTNTPTHATQVGNTTYDGASGSWAKRTIVTQPDGHYASQFFDETGAVLGRMISAGNPASSPGNMWFTDVVRDSVGCVTVVRSPANCDNATYNHTTGAITPKASGLITNYSRLGSAGNLNGLCTQRTVQDGTGGSPTTIWSINISEVQLSVGASGVSIAQVDDSTNPADSSVTNYSYTYWSVTNTDPLYITPQVIETIAPPVSDGSLTTDHNGSGSSVSTFRYIRKDGSTAYTQDGSGVIFYSGRGDYNQIEKQIADYNPSTNGFLSTLSSADDDANWSLGLVGSGAIHAVTTMSYDDQGRMLTRVQPSYGSSGSTTRTITYKYALDGAQLATFISPLLSGGNYHGPLSFSRVNHAGKPDRRATIEISSPSGSIPTSASPGGAWSALVDTVYDQSGMRPEETYTYTSTIAADVSTLEYDATGRKARMIDATGTITRLVYDERGLLIERWIGTNDNGWADPPGSGAGLADMVKVEGLVYGAGTGDNGWLTARSQDEDGNWGTPGDRHTTSMQYDFRGRKLVQINPVQPHQLYKYDELNRVLAVGNYAGSGSGLTGDPTSTGTVSSNTRVGLNETFYDERGQVWRTLRWGIDPTSGSKYAVGIGLTPYGHFVDNWYDDNMRLVKSLGAQRTKTSYDRLGRPQDRFILYSDNDSAYSDALDVAGDTVLEQHHTGYDPPSGAALLEYVVQRHHDDTTTNTALCTDTDPLAADSSLTFGRIQISAMWYDNWDRLTNTVAYGTNGGTAYTRPGGAAPSASSSSQLVTITAYDNFGRLLEVTDAGGVVARTEYDFAGRRSKTIGNYTGGSPGGGANGDQDQEVNYVYVNGLIDTVIRRMSASSSDDQATTYKYGSTVALGSVISTNNLLYQLILPEQVTGSPSTAYSTTMTYNGCSQPLQVTDFAGNVFDYSYDAGGRVTTQAVTPFTGFDTRVGSVVTSYNTRGMVESVKNKDAGGTVVDEMAYTYDQMGNLLTLKEDPDSAVGASGRAVFTTTLAWTLYGGSPSFRGSVMTQWTMPWGSGATGPYRYINSDAVGRITRIDDDNFLNFANYKFLGANTVIGFQSIVDNNMYGAGGSSTYGTYLDDFNRPIKNEWVGGTGPVSFIDQTATYDPVGAMLTLQDDVLKDASGNRNFDYLCTYDNLHRLIARQEGELGSGPSISPQSRIENSARNLAGRIVTDEVSLDSNTTYTDGSVPAINAGEMSDARTYNKRNELNQRDYIDQSSPSTPITVNQTYDKNGNLTSDGEKYTYKYDPWNRLVEIHDYTSTNLLAKYTYNGLGQRISEQLDTDNVGGSGVADNIVDSNDKVFYIAVDPQGRRIGTYRNTDSKPKETFFYHPVGNSGPACRGGPIVRTRDTNLAGNPTQWSTAGVTDWDGEEYFYCTDLSGNIIAMVDDLIEQQRYSPSGVPFGIPAGDLDGDGEVNDGPGQTDYDIWLAAKNIAYEVRADLDMDGTIGGADLAIVTMHDKLSLGRGQFSLPEVRNIKGFQGCEVFGSGLHTLWASRVVVDAGTRLRLNSPIAQLSVISFLPTVPPDAEERCAAAKDRVNAAEAAATLANAAAVTVCRGPQVLTPWGAAACAIAVANAAYADLQLWIARSEYGICQNALPVSPPRPAPVPPTTQPLVPGIDPTYPVPSLPDPLPCKWREHVWPVPAPRPGDVDADCGCLEQRRYNNRLCGRCSNGSIDDRDDCEGWASRQYSRCKQQCDYEQSPRYRRWRDKYPQWEPGDEIPDPIWNPLPVNPTSPLPPGLGPERGLPTQ